MQYLTLSLSLTKYQLLNHLKLILNFGTGVQVGEVGGKFKLLTDKKRNGLGHSCDLSLKLEPSESNPPCSSRFLSAECSPAAAAVAAATPSPSAEDPLPDWTDDLLPTMLPAGSLPRRLRSTCLDQQVNAFA